MLCPKKLEANWTRYPSWAAQRNNPFEKDRYSYAVMAHTDLSRYEGRAGAIDLSRFNWGAFDLVVIDESHNFRNEGSDRVDEEGRVVRRSRYNRLLEEVVKDGVRTKLLMLSATPVNTSLRDLRNQIYVMTEKRQDAFRQELGISDIQRCSVSHSESFSSGSKRAAAADRSTRAPSSRSLVPISWPCWMPSRSRVPATTFVVSIPLSRSRLAVFPFGHAPKTSIRRRTLKASSRTTICMTASVSCASPSTCRRSM